MDFINELNELLKKNQFNKPVEFCKKFTVLGLAGFFGFFNVAIQLDLRADLKEENLAIHQASQELAKFYDLPKGKQIREITHEVIASHYTSPQARASIKQFGRRIFVFKYLSENFWVKGTLSFTPLSNQAPLILFFRGGNREFSLPNPGDDLLAYENETVVLSTLRGGVSEGTDEFGGREVIDIKYLLEKLPELEKELNVSINQKPLFLIGESRGGMELFLFLAKFPEIQEKVSKIAVLSGLVDLSEGIKERKRDMEVMFRNDFGLTNANFEEWIKQRNPIGFISKIRKTIPILILQGTNDPRVSLVQGKNMEKALRASGHLVDYYEVQGGNHTLNNIETLNRHVFCWLRSSQGLSCFRDLYQPEAIK